MSRFHGIFSLMLIFISIAVGFIAISSTSSLLAGIYAVVTALSSIGIVYFYCSKCTCREYACGHVLPGKLTTIFPDRKPGNYSALDMTMTTIALVLVVGFPQYWLWKYKPLFAVFWALTVFALADILLCVCKRCENKHCPICPNGRLSDPC